MAVKNKNKQFSLLGVYKNHLITLSVSKIHCFFTEVFNSSVFSLIVSLFSGCVDLVLSWPVEISYGFKYFCKLSMTFVELIDYHVIILFVFLENFPAVALKS